MRLLAAIAERNRDALTAMLADDVVFHSPVQSYRGRQRVVHLLVIIGGILDGVDVAREVNGVTFFAAEIGEHPVDGVLDEHTGADGRVEEFTLMLRPLAALQGAVARMARALAEGA